MGTMLSRFILISALYQILAIHFSPCICSAKQVSAIFVFGDSLVDVGNNFYIKTPAQPTWPNGIDFVTGSPSGRYTNNRTVVDIIEEELGFRTYTPPYFDPKTTGDVILKGVNYASSASGIFNSTGSHYGALPSMDAQISCFTKTRQELISRIGAAAARKLLRRALYFVLTGTNDITTAMTNSSSLAENIKTLDKIIAKFGSQLTALYNLDARKIALTNAPPFGCTPFSRDKYSTDDCFADLNELAKLYNIRLRKLLSKLASLAGSTFVYMDAYAALYEIIRNYKSYGLEIPDSACCRVFGKHGGKFPCVFFSSFCLDRSKYLFWDAYHPTDAVNVILAKRVLDGDSRYVSPMNIRQLANS